MSDSEKPPRRADTSWFDSLAKDLPLTSEDIAVLRRLKDEVRLSPAQYERFLEQFGHASVEELRRRPCFRGEPFEL
ncbi:MAG: hypothetical protein K0U98_00680 [Deltaproteobacteria bacterium]|nr:hypothetical protein [Deltaproteobacteria bacterium]